VRASEINQQGELVLKAYGHDRGAENLVGQGFSFGACSRQERALALVLKYYRGRLKGRERAA
jgi:hypothetical protein